MLYTGGCIPANADERKKITDEWMDLYKKIDTAVVDHGSPSSPMAKNISWDGKVYDGPAGQMVTGHTIIKAMSLDAAIQLAKSCPTLKSEAKISVYETINAMA